MTITVAGINLGKLREASFRSKLVLNETNMFVYLFFFFFGKLLETIMATHSNILAWRIPGTGEPGGLPSMGSHRVGHD